MIFIYHNTAKVIAVENEDGQSIAFDDKVTIIAVLYALSRKFNTEKLVWCHSDYREFLNKEELNTLFHHDKLVLSYRPDDSNYFGEAIGYVDASLFVNVNKKVSFPTWQMSSVVGMIHTAVLLKAKEAISFESDFDYYLNSLAKVGMPSGLLCYSEPQLLKKGAIKYNGSNATNTTTFRFIKQHYKTHWVFLLLFNSLLYERKFPIFSFLCSFFYKNRINITFDLEAVKVKSSRIVVDKKTIDVIIPTIGRKTYLYDVLCDLKVQTHLPQKVIVVEQNPNPNSVSELDYLHTQEWPFKIKHIFTHQAGACNARNWALSEVENEWIFFADDDIRFEPDCVQETLNQIGQFGLQAVSLRCFQKGQKQSLGTIFQWGSFGSGCSFVSSAISKKCTFQMGYEFGFGEDGDFGMQLRNQGQDVLYLPEPEILHLKAPMGGFRTKPVVQWQNDEIQPKPSPTIMLYQIVHNSLTQISSYKTTLFFKYYRLQKIKNPLRYYLNFQKQWKSSVFWANELNKKQ